MSYHCSLSQFHEPSGGQPRKGCPAWLLAKLKAEADRLFIYRHYDTLGQFCEAHKLTLTKGNWRLCNPPKVGHINGLYTSWGLLTATDGVLCYIEQGDKGLFLGHLENFEQFTDEDSREPEEPTKRKRRSDIASVILFD